MREIPIRKISDARIYLESQRGYSHDAACQVDDIYRLCAIPVFGNANSSGADSRVLRNTDQSLDVARSVRGDIRPFESMVVENSFTRLLIGLDLHSIIHRLGESRYELVQRIPHYF